MKALLLSRPAHVLHWVVSPILAFGIYLSILNLSSTYFRVQNYQREAVWSLVHLNTQLAQTQHDMQLHGLGNLPVKALRTRYELLWSKFDVILSNVARDDMLGNVHGLREALDDAFRDFKAMESEIYSGENIPPVDVERWIGELGHSHEVINRFLLHEVADADGDYGVAAWQSMLNSLYLVGLAGLVFVGHIGFLLLSLMRERSSYLFELSHDSLTGLSNRHHSLLVLEEFCRDHLFFSLIIVDLNEFKQVNDVYGHPAGDQVLVHLSHEFKETLGKHGLVGRLGGDEFLWIVNTTSQEEVDGYFLKLLHRLAQPYSIGHKQLHLCLSAGGVACHGDNPNPKGLLAKADEAMYFAKKSKSHEISWHKPGKPSESGFSTLISFL